MPHRPRRRSSDRKPPDPGSRTAFVAGGVLLAIVAGWFVWQWAATLEPVRDGAPAWSPDGTKIAFYSEQPVEGPGGRRGQADLFEINVDGTGLRRLTDTPDADEGSPAYSPDGRYLAYDTDRDGNFEIYVKDLEAPPDAPDVRVTTHAGRDLAPAWSPDGRLAFMSNRSSPPDCQARQIVCFDVYMMDADGANLRRVTTEPSNWFPQFSPDGERIAMHVWRDVHVMTLETGVRRQLTYEPADGMYPTWSPTGDRIAFMTRRNNRMEIFVMDPNGANQEPLVTMPAGDAIDPRWSPDGKYIAFVNVSEESPQAEQTETNERVIYLLELETRRVRRLRP